MKTLILGDASYPGSILRPHFAAAPVRAEAEGTVVNHAARAASSSARDNLIWVRQVC